MRISFNDNNSKKGVEGWFEFIDEKLIIYIKPTNSREDWKSDFIAFRSNDILAKCKVHTGFKMYARWMNDFIIKLANIKAMRPEDIYIFGYSMGGGIAQILGEYNSSFNIISVDGPRTTTKLSNKKSTLYFNKGSLVNNVPFWFKRIENAICLNYKWRPFWKSHVDYDINEIIERVIN
jgi:pimeloyl-ACP methyl ester carboxylesterase